VLIVVPKNVIRNWLEEFNRWRVAGKDCIVETLSFEDMKASTKAARLRERARVLEKWFKTPDAKTDR
jgi:SNF2 family DNA or RNA helicase